MNTRYTQNLSLVCRVFIRQRHMSARGSANKECLYGPASCHAALFAGYRRMFNVYLNRTLEGQRSQNKLINEVVTEAEKQRIPIHYFSAKTLDRLSKNDSHQNIVVEAGKRKYEELPANISPTKKDKIGRLLLALDHVENPATLGAILRSCTFFGVHNIVVCRSNSCELTPAISKFSSGASEWLRIYGVGGMSKFAKRAFENGWEVLGTTVDRIEPIPHDYGQTSVKYCGDVLIDKPTVLVVNCSGSFDDNVLKHCSHMVSIDSFNPLNVQDRGTLNPTVEVSVMLRLLLEGCPNFVTADGPVVR